MYKDSIKREYKLVSVKAVAEILGIATRTVWRLAKDKKMPRPVKVGGLMRWRIKDIEKWIDLGCKRQNKVSKKRKKKGG